MLTILGRPNVTCEGTSRRQLLQAGGAGLLGVTLQKMLAAENEQPFSGGRAKSVLFLFLFGGPSQLETWDMKPQAPSRIRGPFKPVSSRTPGLLISEHLSRCAQVSDKFCVLRNLSHPVNAHSAAAHYIQTGCRWHIADGGGHEATSKDWPSMGSVVEYLAQHSSHRNKRDLSSYVVLPNTLGRLQGYRRPGEYGGWLGRGYNALTTQVGDAPKEKNKADNLYFRDCRDEELTFQIEGLVSQKEMTVDRLNRRKSLLDQFDDQRRALNDSEALSDYGRLQQRAFSLMASSRIREALDIRQEADKLRDAYGRNLFGQATLMGRRMIEAGARFVTVNWDAVDGYSWDSHRSSYYLQNHLLPGLDQALSSLLIDLDDRGLLDETLVVVMGEMGRTPKANSKWGRGHWSTLFPAVLAGAGVNGGTLYGESDKDAAYSLTKPTSPEDMAATIYRALGIDPELRIPDAQGRPTHIVHGGSPITEIFG